MTEERYYCNENLVVIDSKTKKSCSYFKCMNLLNEKEKEIKELKNENEQLKQKWSFVDDATQQNIEKMITIEKGDGV